MKKIMLFVLLSLAYTGVLCAQGAYPPKLAGVLAPSGFTEDLALIVGEHFNLPWSAPAPDFETGSLVDVEVWTTMPESPENPYASQILVSKKCAVYHYNNGVCLVPGPSTTKRYQWDPLAQAYVIETALFPDGSLSFDAWTWKGDHWEHTEGHLYFEAHPPQYYWFTWYAWEFEPFISLPPLAEGHDSQTATALN